MIGGGSGCERRVGVGVAGLMMDIDMEIHPPTTHHPCRTAPTPSFAGLFTYFNNDEKNDGDKNDNNKNNNNNDDDAGDDNDLEYGWM